MKRPLLFLTALLLVFSCSSPVLDSPDGMLSVMMEDNELVILHQGKPVQTIEMSAGHFIRTARAKVGGVSARIFKCDSTDVEVRVYDTGVAYRFLNGERKVAYVIPDGMKRWLGYYGFTGYEALFPESSSCVPGKWIYPALLEYGDGLFGFIAEAGIERGHSCSHLVSTDDSGRYCLETTDEETEYNVTPWRFVLVGELPDIVESTIVTDLSAPCKLEDTSWIKPGVSSWIYWAYNHGSKDYGIIKDYIDLAAEMGWPYCLVDWEWPDMEGGKTIDDVIAYADEKGVRLNLWYNSGTSWTGPGSPQPEDRIRTAESREEEFSWLESKGIAGVKIDFFSEDGADMVNYYIDILEDAARHHLLVDFHGCTIPRGWQHTYPNLMSMEAVYGAEWYNNVPSFTTKAASHNATLPFTRNVMGPMDYTPCTFTDSQHPHITSDAHELALPILFQSSLQHMADRPEAYLSLPEEVRILLSGLPAVWDETRLLNGYPGDHVVIARRSGDKWYIAGINGTDNPGDLELDLSKLGISKASVTLFLDSDEGDGFDISTCDDMTYFQIGCLPRGGFAALVQAE